MGILDDINACSQFCSLVSHDRKCRLCKASVLLPSDCDIHSGYPLYVSVTNIVPYKSCSPVGLGPSHIISFYLNSTL